MNVKSFHLGSLDLVRQLCVDKQKEIYKSSYELKTNWPAGFHVPEYRDVREAKDTLFLSWMMAGAYVMDSDVLPLFEFYPDRPGLWLPGSYGRPDYYMGAAIGNDAVGFIENLFISYEKNPSNKIFGWPVIAYREYAGVINWIPKETYCHLALTSSLPL